MRPKAAKSISYTLFLDGETIPLLALKKLFWGIKIKLKGKYTLDSSQSKWWKWNESVVLRYIHTCSMYIIEESTNKKKVESNYRIKRIDWKKIKPNSNDTNEAQRERERDGEKTVRQETIHSVVIMPKKIYIFFLILYAGACFFRSVSLSISISLVCSLAPSFALLAISPRPISLSSFTINTRIRCGYFVPAIHTHTLGANAECKRNFCNCKKMIKIFTTILQSEFAKVYYNRLT